MNISGNTHIPTKPQQNGVGLLEVLISLLLLGIAALGYSALQAQSLKSTSESLTRTQAVTLLRDTAERIRVNAIDATFQESINAASTPALDIGQALNFYQTAFNSSAIPSIQTCPSTGCTIQNIANTDVREIKLAAKQYGISIGMATCPGTASPAEQSKCLIAAWNETTATIGSSAADCARDTGAYRLNADCIYMEAY